MVGEPRLMVRFHPMGALRFLNDTKPKPCHWGVFRVHMNAFDQSFASYVLLYFCQSAYFIVVTADVARGKACRHQSG